MLTLTELSGHGMLGGGSAFDFPAGGNFWRGSAFYQATLGGSDTKVGTLSLWHKRTTWSNLEYIHEFPGGWNPCWIDTDDTFRFVANDLSGGFYSVYVGTNAIPRDGLWHHYVVAFDSAAGVALVYRDGVSNKVVYGTQDNTLADWTRASFILGRRYDTDTNYLYGSLAEYYFNTQEFIDVSIPANMAKFRNAAGRPVDLGPDGSWVTGRKPQVYLHHVPGTNNGASTSDFRTNRATGTTMGTNGGGNFEDPLVPSSFWRQVYGVTPHDNASDWSDYTARMRIATAGIVNKPPGQTQVRVTIAASPSSSGITIDKIYIGNQGGGDPWDALDLTQLFFDGAPGVTLVAPDTRATDAANWTYNGGPVLLTAHFVTGGGTPPIGYNPNVQTYSRLADDAAVLNTSGHSASSATYAYLFMGIEMV